MALHVSELDRRKLARSPLTSVVCQVRFDPTPHAVEAKTVQAFHAALGGPTARYQNLASIRQDVFNVAFGPNVLPSLGQESNPMGGWRLSDADGAHVVTLLPQSLALEAKAYDGWEDDFEPQLRATLTALAGTAEPVFEQRLGLRYINQITDPEVSDPTGWQDWIAPEVLGVVAHHEIGPHVRFARQQVVLDATHDVRCTLNHGLAPDPERAGKLTYLIDIDVAREGMRPFDVEAILGTAAEFNSYALRVFQLAVTPGLRDHLANP